MPIFDQGYQHWSGQLSGHAWRWLVVTRHGVRGAMTNRMIRVVLAITMLPAIVLAFVLCIWGLFERQSELIAAIRPLMAFIDQPILAVPRDYRVEVWTLCYSYFLYVQLWCSMLLILMVGPNLISQDLRYNALPLYLSRPIRRIDYFLGKLGVIVTFLGMVIVVPSVVAYVLGMLFSLDITILRDTFGILLASIGYGLVIALSAGMLILALSSLTRNSRYVALMWIAIWFLSGTLSTILVGIDHFQRAHQARQGGHSVQNGELEAQELDAAKTDWRPLVSYTANLYRIGNQMLGTNTSWARVGELRPDKQRTTLLYRRSRDTLYPWYWAAAVLAVLFGISACILNFSIKSLDRLK
jgi:ABC-type transport system involved in multi-copper enzyme maturation permease subunit